MTAVLTTVTALAAVCSPRAARRHQPLKAFAASERLWRSAKAAGSSSSLGSVAGFQRPVAYRRATPSVAVAAAAPSSVRLVIQGRNVEVTPAIREYCEEKVTRAVAHFDGNIKEIDVKLSVRGGDAGKGNREQRTEITCYTLRHGVVRAEDTEDNLYASVDLVCDKLQRSMRKLKEKAVDRGTWPGRGGKAGQEQLYDVLSSQEVVDDLELDRVAQLPKEVVRAKFVELEPMSVDEAVDRLEAIGHDFYVFTENKTNKMQVVYRRKTNGYGVLIPQE